MSWLKRDIEHVLMSRSDSNIQGPVNQAYAECRRCSGTFRSLTPRMPHGSWNNWKLTVVNVPRQMRTFKGQVSILKTWAILSPRNLHKLNTKI
jgi:hypothetical protein